MEVKPSYECFGRRIKFGDISGIKRVFQPGILSLPYFFNPGALNDAISELCGWNPKGILVYFNDIENLDVSSKQGRHKKWWEAFQAFVPLVKDSPAGYKVEYWYGSDGKAFSSPEFRQESPPYQAHVKLFGGAIQGFSCFVNQDPNEISFDSIRCNIDIIKPGEGLVHDKKSLWIGQPKDFLESAQILYDAFYEMDRQKYDVGVETMAGERRREVRIICPERGALVGSLYGSDSVALLIENESLEKMVREHMARERASREIFERITHRKP